MSQYSTHTPLREPSEDRYVFNRHATRLLPHAGTPTASWDVDGFPIAILLSAVPELMMDKHSPGEFKGNCFHYLGVITAYRGKKLPADSDMVSILHCLLEHELNIGQIREHLVDVEGQQYQSQVALGLEDGDAGLHSRAFCISFRVTDAAMLEVALEDAKKAANNRAKLEELHEQAVAATAAANKIVADLSNTQH